MRYSNVNSRLRTYSQRIGLASFAAIAVTACQAPDGSPNPNASPIVAPSLTQTQINAVCDPFGASGNSTPGGPLNGLVANLSYLPNGNTNEYTGVMDFEKKATPVSTPVYLTQLYVPTESFSEGFSTGNGTYLSDNNGNKLIEYFALHIESSIELTPSDSEGDYQFALVSDDGSIMQINNGSSWSELINNDHDHETELGCAETSVALTHSSQLPIQIDYYQGPRYNIALILLWRKVSSNSSWHDDDSGQCDGGNANPLNDPDCGRWSNDLYFDWENQSPSIPNSNWVRLLARGWSVVPPKNFVLANGNQNPCNTNTQCYTDTFTQPQQLSTSSVDLLLMTDTHGGYNLADISDGLPNFASQLPAGVDFSVGLMGAFDSKGSPGTLMHAPSVSSVLSSKSLAMSDMQTELAQSINYLPNSHQSNGGAMGLYSLTQAMAPANVQAEQASGFMRPSAALSVVFVSDTPDECSANPNSSAQCAGVTPASTLAAVEGVKGTLPLSINAILNHANNNGCSDNSGTGYGDLVSLLGHGVIVDMIFGSCDTTVSNFPQAMQSVGQQIAMLLKKLSGVSLLNDFTLSHTGVDPSTIAVSVDGTVEQYSYNAGQDQVGVSQAGTYGSTIQVNYCLAQPTASPSPSPTVSVTSTPSPSPSPSVTVTPSPSPSPSVTVTPSPSPSPSVTVTPSPSPSPSVTVTPSPSPSPSVTVTPSPSPSPSITVTPSPSPSPSVTVTPSPSPSPSPSSSCTGPFCGGGPLGN